MDKLGNIVAGYLSSGKLIAMTSILRFSSNELHEDFISEIVLILLEYKDKKKMLQLHENGELDFFIMRIIRNQYGNKYSTWNRLFGNYEAGKEATIL